ncbi:MAG: putative holin-like toxin [Sphingomonas sp.]|nr:putative holin-like toxin [Sphingomonas sp.]
MVNTQTIATLVLGFATFLVALLALVVELIKLGQG